MENLDMLYGSGLFINNHHMVNGCAMNMFSSPCCGMGGFAPGCFGYGFYGGNMANAAITGAGIGLGLAAGMALPAVFKVAGQACGWLWNNAIVPVGKFIGNIAVGAWNGIKAVGSWIGNGVKNLWNGIFHKGGKEVKE